MFRITFDRNHVNRFRLVKMNIDRKSEISRQVAADFVPGLAGIIAAHDIPVFLHEKYIRARPMHSDAMNAMPDFGVGIGNIL